MVAPAPSPAASRAGRERARLAGREGRERLHEIGLGVLHRAARGAQAEPLDGAVGLLPAVHLARLALERGERPLRLGGRGAQSAGRGGVREQRAQLQAVAERAPRHGGEGRCGAGTELQDHAGAAEGRRHGILPSPSSARAEACREGTREGRGEGAR
ncbi:hypothetical protein Adeh_3893 [Anaeromyxobacter dehalogenans 2CP-C]|uniref:Uncharacterized protein n=1 Tax=Anaeromyxobacter dehalogenans (strain 2CP-C) TaxID=290397 RepID=Q2IGE9_ANADE|nr:hypothetical protein Adeh_3893 [Anaeromyxobacter dehalogenans 2CP-C]